MHDHRALGMITPALLFATLALASSFAACSSSEPPPDKDGVAASQAARGAELTGTWRFVYDGARRHDVEAKLAAEIADPQKLAAAKAEAEQEAAASEIEFTTDGWFLSRIAGKEIDRMPYTVERVAEDALRLTMMKGGQARSTEVELGSSGGARRIVIVDPQKGSLTFEQK
jgi:hypothetical protein